MSIYAHLDSVISIFIFGSFGSAQRQGSPDRVSPVIIATTPSRKIPGDTRSGESACWAVAINS